MADKLRRPLNAPPGITPAPGVQPGVNQGVVVATRVIVVGPAGTVTGVFVYAPGTTPGLGNFPTAWMTTATTDPFGNVLPVAAVIGTTSIYAADGVFFSTGGAAGAAVIPNGSGGVNIQTTGGQYVNITTGPFASVLGTVADPTIITTDTGTTASIFGTDWGASGSGANGAIFQLQPNGWVNVAIDVKTTAAAPAAEICAIPAGYAPTTSIVCGALLPTAGGGAAYPLTAFSTGTLQQAGVPGVNGVRYAGIITYPGPGLSLP